MFVGFLQQPGGGPCFMGNWDPDELSSLHSSPSPIHRHPFGDNASPTDPTEPHHNDVEPEELNPEDTECMKDFVPSPLNPVESFDFNQSSEQVHSQIREPLEPRNQQQDRSKSRIGDTVRWHPSEMPAEARVIQFSEAAGVTTQRNGRLPDLTQTAEKHFNLSNQRQRRSSSSESWFSSPELDQSREEKFDSTCTNGESRVKTHNNNDVRLKSSEQDQNSTSPPAQARTQIFALYNHTEEVNTSLRFYSLRVPLQVQKEAGLITEVHTHWLDYMTQHFISGAQLIDGFFHLGDNIDNGVSSVDSVFIFQGSAEETPNSYDAIVVEQWTIVDGVVVKTDYVPLLQSLAPYGWKLMCVLPTPIVKTNSDGSLSTKQILFLQRPILQRKRKDFKMLYLKGRSKAKKKSTGGTQEEMENMSPLMETELFRLSRNTEEEEEESVGTRSRDSGCSKGAGLQGTEKGAWHRRGLLSGSRESVEEQEEETDVDEFPPSAQKSVRWTDVCRGDHAGWGKEEVKTEERIRQQLFSGVC